MSESHTLCDSVAVEIVLANRRDALLLLLLAAVVAGAAWERGTAALLVGLAVVVTLYAMLLLLLRQSSMATQSSALATSADRQGHAWMALLLPPFWTLALLFIGSSFSTMLVARLLWLEIGSFPLTALLASLAFGWQIWIYFWTGQPPAITQEER